MENTNLAEKLFFSKEAADYLGITVQRLNKLVQEGKIRPIKKNSSGAVYHIDELNKRKEELRIFNDFLPNGKKGTFRFDTKAKIEALNFAVLMNALNYTEKKLDPYFEEFSKCCRTDDFMDKEGYISAYSDFFKISPDQLKTEFQKAYHAFLTLRETDEIIKRGSEEYPPLLSKTKEAPRFLYIRGKKALLYEDRTVALVGSRQAGEKAVHNTERLAKILGENGITVISGLAKGIDVSAHKSALKNGFNTIAVIGTNLNQYYPSENKEVQLEIERKGLIVSQFSPANKTQRWFFPLRNGVMSGLSLATIIMEAGETSGALKQADFALKQGRQVFIPKNALHLKQITWPARYVERGAVVVEKPSDVIRQLAENNIFRLQENDKILQQTLAASSFEQKEEKTDDEWSIPIHLDE